MKKTKIFSLLLLLGEILLLAAAIILVIKFIPDFRDGKGPLPPASGSSAGESSGGESSGGAGKNGGREESGGEDGSGGREPAESESGTAGEYGGASGTGGREGGGKGGGTSGEGDGTAEPYVPPTLILASDLHYLSPAMTDYGEAFQTRMETDDGKVLLYQEQILDAFLEETVKQNPAALILSGDISYSGERVNHEELAKKLRTVRDAGIPVLVIPGNHDILHPWAASYFGERQEEAEQVDADGFYQIYREFGYDQAADRDESSLSYLYELDGRYWLMMLDSCIYDPVNETGGRIRRSTLEWMEQWLEKAKEEGVTVIPIAHHNLLRESELYPEECTLENGREVIDLLESFGLPVYVSGHLHLQRVKKNVNSPLTEGQYGICEIVSGALSIPPCQYGVMRWVDDGSFTYQTRRVDVSSWAREQKRQEEELLNFENYADGFLTDVIAGQLFGYLTSIPDDRKQEMADLYGEINSRYCAGKTIDRAKVKREQTYFYWERYLGTTKWFDRLSAILKDARRDQNSLSLKPGVDFPAVERKPEEETEGGTESGSGSPYVYGAG